MQANILTLDDPACKLQGYVPKKMEIKEGSGLKLVPNM